MDPITATVYFPATVALRCYTAYVMELLTVREAWGRALGIPA